MLRHPLGTNLCLQLLILSLMVCWQPLVEAQVEQTLPVRYLTTAPEKPLLVEVGIQVDQIININQKSENFSVVGNLLMKWHQPEIVLALGPSDFEVKTFTPEAFVDLIDKLEIHTPGFLIQNQQGRRFSQDSRIDVARDGNIVYF